MSKKMYYIPGVDKLNQLEETPASKEKTELRRYVFNTIVSVISAVAAIAAAILALLTYLR